MGFQEPAPGPRSDSRPRRLGWWIAAAAISLALGLLLREADPETSRAARDESVGVGFRDAGGALPPATPTPPPEDPSVAALRSQVESSQREIATLQEERRRLETELARAERDRERYRGGLKEAVAELERLGEELERLRWQAGRGRAPTSPPPLADRVRPLGAPHVTTSPMGFVVASGLVYNPHDYPTRGSLEVSLVGSAGLIETRELLVHIGPQSTERYDVTFTHVFPTERLAAQARWLE